MSADAVHVRCYAELNDALPPERRYTTFGVPLEGPRPVAEVLRRAGVSVAAVDLVLRDGVPAALADAVRPGERLAVYPEFEAFDIAPATRLPGRPLRRPRFVLDVHLGRLARWLRMLGFDTWWRARADDEELAAVARDEGRILLSRDRRLVARPGLPRACRVRADRPAEQAREVVARLHLEGRARPFTRCLVCNGELVPAAPEAVAARVPARVRREQREFRCCPDCGRVYWKGSHFHRMERLVAALTQRGPAAPPRPR